MMKRKKKPKPDNLLKLNFTVGHACPKDRTAIDWRDFELIEDQPDFYVFRCPTCRLHACISMGIESDRFKFPLTRESIIPRRRYGKR